MAEVEKVYHPEESVRSTRWRILAPLISLVGGLAGLVGAFIAEWQQSTNASPFVFLLGAFLGPFVAGPIIEEALKPTGVYLILARWTRVLQSRLYTAFLAALGGLGFGLIENVLYLQIYYPEHSPQLTLFRYTAGLLLHAGCSFIVGFGINQKLVMAVKGEIPFLSANKRYFIAAMVIHSVYNILAVFVFQRWLGT